MLNKFQGNERTGTILLVFDSEEDNGGFTFKFRSGESGDSEDLKGVSKGLHMSW